MMSGVIRQETAVFLLSVLHGIAFTFGYDLLRALRRAFAHSVAAVSAEDFLFWAAAACSTFAFVFFRTDGVIRGYVAAGIAIGAVLYHFAASGPVLRVFSCLFSTAGRIVRAVFAAAARPLKKTGRFWKKTIEIVGKSGYNQFKKFLRGRRNGREEKEAEQQQSEGDGCDRRDRVDPAGGAARQESGYPRAEP